jgi:outer membrane autotransporter protein
MAAGGTAGTDTGIGGAGGSSPGGGAGADATGGIGAGGTFGGGGGGGGGSGFTGGGGGNSGAYQNGGSPGGGVGQSFTFTNPAASVVTGGNGGQGSHLYGSGGGGGGGAGIGGGGGGGGGGYGLGGGGGGGGGGAGVGGGGATGGYGAGSTGGTGGNTAGTVSIINNGKIYGGSGAAGVNYSLNPTQHGNGGSGGDAIGFGGGGGLGGGAGGLGGLGGGITGLATTIINAGLLRGGNGGAPSPGLTTGGGVGGVGIHGGNLTIVNSGTIAGGLDGNTGTLRSNAILFTGGINSLELQSGWMITGNVGNASGVTNTTNTLILGGSAANLSGNGAATGTIFDVSQIGAKYQSFDAFQKSGAGTWQLTYATPLVTPWTITGGTLQIGNDAVLGNASGTVTFGSTDADTGLPGSGTLEVTANTSSMRNIILNDIAGFANTIQVDPGVTYTLRIGVISGAGALTKFGAGMLVLDAKETYAGLTNVTAGTLVVGDANSPSASLSGGGAVSIASGATLGGFGSVAGSVTNNGTVAIGNALSAYASTPNITFNIGGNLTNSGLITLVGAAPGNTLKVAGNYTSNGGVLALNTLLNAGGSLTNQSTDRLLIAGSDPGVTTIQIHPTGSGAFTATGVPTASNGISLVQVGGSSSPGDFVLPGGFITGGTPFRYQIYAYGAGSPNGPADPSQNLVGNPSSYWDYRLQNVYVDPSGPVSPLPSSGTARPPSPPGARLEVAPQVPAYITVPTALFNAGWQDIDELHRRLGEIRDAQQQGSQQRVEVFVRAYGSTYSYTSTRAFTDYGFNSAQEYAALQFGGSAIALDNEAGTLRVGLAGALGRLWFQPSAVDGPSKGLFNSEKLAGIVTWQSRAGWYLDGIVAGGLLDGQVSTAAHGEATGLNGTSFTASIEAGYPIPLGWQKLVAEPEVQIAYQHLNFGSRTDTDGLGVSLGGQDQGMFRVGGRLVRQLQAENGTLISPYLKANLLQGLGNSGDISVGGFSFGAGSYGTALQLGGGATGTLTNHLAIYGEVDWQHQVSNGGFRGWAFNGGLRYDF